MLAWLRTQGGKGEAALAAHDQLVALGAEARATRERDLVFGQLRSTGALGGVATQLYRLSIERAKPDAAARAGLPAARLPTIEGGLQADGASLRAGDGPHSCRRTGCASTSSCRRRSASPRSTRGSAATTTTAINRALDKLAKTKLGNTDERLKLVDADRAAFEASNDPAIQFAVAMHADRCCKLEERSARPAPARSWPRARSYLQAMADYKKSQGEFVYPDANSSLRITFGNVTGYTKLDGSKQAPFTTLEEVAAKATGEEPFDAPKPLLDAIAAKNYGGLADKRLGTVPVNFLSDLDITGGNSGSPVLDAHGKLVGLAFDGNWESVSSTGCSTR